MTSLSMSQVEHFLQELASLIRAGLPVPEGLRQLSAHFDSDDLRKLSQEVGESMSKGASLSHALSRSSLRVPSELVAVMRCAETSGEPQAIVDFALEHIRRMRIHRDALINAAFYPILAACLMILLAQLGSWTVLADLRGLFARMGVSPNHYQQLLWTASEFLASPAGVIASALALFLLAGPLLTESGNNRLLDLLSHTPFVRPLVDLSDSAMWLRFTGAMLARNVPLHEALRAASLAVNSHLTRTALGEMAIAAERGHRISDRLPGGTPSAAAYMFEQGESRGCLGSSCPAIAGYCEQKFELLSRRASQLLEPALLVVLGMFVTAYLYAWYGPLFDLPKHIGF